MNLLTKAEIYAMYSEPTCDAEMVEFANDVEAAVLAKLAGMELPEPVGAYDIQTGQTGTCHDAYSLDQLRQAYAQGAASVLSAEPFGFVSLESVLRLKECGGNGSRGTVPLHGKKTPISATPLFTRKEPS